MRSETAVLIRRGLPALESRRPFRRDVDRPLMIVPRIPAPQSPAARVVNSVFVPLDEPRRIIEHPNIPAPRDSGIRRTRPLVYSECRGPP